MKTTGHSTVHPSRARGANGPRVFAFQAAIYLALCVLILAMAPALSGCSFQRKDDLTAPRPLLAPYDASRTEPVWAVYPLRNETGTSLAQSAQITDAVIAAAAQARNLRVLPLNRTLEAMMALDLNTLATPEDARQLVEAMGVDGIVLGSITAYDPYTPTIGLSLALYIPPGVLERQEQADLDPRALTWQPTDYAYFPASGYADAPASSTAQHLDGKNHAVQMAVRDYAQGRSEPGSALGWRRYLASSILFTEFAAYHAVGKLLDQEWIRIASNPRRSPRPPHSPSPAHSQRSASPGG
jgi:hypothetical protein